MILNRILLIVMLIMAVFLLGQNSVLGKQDILNNFTNSSIDKISKLNTEVHRDTLLPTVSVTYPAYPPTLINGNITLKGTANDSNGINVISAEARSFPLNESKTIKPVHAPSVITRGNFSNWSITFAFKQPGVYRIVVTARDNEGNLGNAQTTVNFVPIKESTFEPRTIEPRLAFVRPTFTEAAYSDNGFYDFYFKYGFPSFDLKITKDIDRAKDLDMLTVKTPKSVSEFPKNNYRHLSNITSLIPINGTEIGNFPKLEEYWLPFIDNIKKVVPNNTLTIMRDEDVHDGHIFYGHNKTNAYDVLLLFHNEYVTQDEYDNLKQFVKNGGTIVFIDANAFYAEVRYDKGNGTITLVKGHDWEYDGKTARRSVPERWYNETKQWVGSNYLLNYLNSNTTFKNNPFNYTHFEEQFVNNQKDEILKDYGVELPKDFADDPYRIPVDKKLEDIAVATYKLNYGKGKVIVLGLYGQRLAKIQGFMKFFDDVVLSNALCSNSKSCFLGDHADSNLPSVNITEPSYPPTIPTGKIIIEGTSNDSGSGIANVSAYVHTFPFDGHFPVKLASQPIPISPNNWSHWSFPFIINSTDSYRVVVTAKDNAGNKNYAETVINAALPSKNQIGTNEVISKNTIPKISFVRPTFTEAAYQEHGFYRFYMKYGFPPVGTEITSDIDMFTVKTPRSVPEFRANNLTKLSHITSLVPIKGTELCSVSFDYCPVPQKYWDPFINHVKKAAPNAIVTVMRDEDIHDGHIFLPGNNNRTNVYDILLLFHNEYVTQQEYDNLKQFVKNGGTIVFIDANALYVEVRYDRDNHTITLVKGHSWEFDGKTARSMSGSERWYNETKEWVGSNYLVNFIKNKITFANNPFNYTHFEEQFVNNPKDSIIIDYVIKYPREDNETSTYIKSQKVATYTLDYGKGKVIMLGLSARLMAENKEFMEFFDNVILLKSLCPKFQSCFSS